MAQLVLLLVDLQELNLLAPVELERPEEFLQLFPQQ